MKFFEIIYAAWQTFWKNRKYIPLFVLNDTLFVWLMTVVQKEVFEKAAPALQRVMAALQAETTEALAAVAPSPEVFQNPQFLAAAHEVFKYIGLALLFGFLIWTGAKGIQWYLANKIVKKKVPWTTYAVKFCAINAFWMFAFVIITVFGINLLDYTVFSAFPLFGENFVVNLTFAFLFVLSYFAFISYCLPPKPVFKQTFRLGIKKWRTLLPVHLVTVLLIFIATALPANLIRQYPIIAFAVSIFLCLPAIAFGRVYWVTAVETSANRSLPSVLKNRRSINRKRFLTR